MTQETKNILEQLHLYGLTLNSQSGGFFLPDHQYRVKKGSAVDHITLTDTALKKTIRFYNGYIFLKSIETTENALNLKLFT